MDDIVEFIKKNQGFFSVRFDGDRWIVAVEFGSEAPDSPMAAGASYGIGHTLEYALATVRDELRLPPKD